MLCKEHQREFKGFLKAKKLKATPARLEFLEIFAHEKKPISIRQLKTKVQLKTDLVTLYRNAEIFTGLGLLNRINLGSQKDYFEFAKKNHHHHLICTRCGKVSDVSSCQVGVISNQTIKSAGFAHVSKHSLEFFGLCRQCVNN